MTDHRFQDGAESERLKRESIRHNRMDQKYSVCVRASKVTAPPFCTCCMRQTATAETVRYSASRKSGIPPGANRTVSLNLPLCPDCLAHRKKATRLHWLLPGLSSLSALAGAALFSRLFSTSDALFWILPILFAAAVYALLGLLFRMPQLGIEHSSLFQSAWISSVNFGDDSVHCTFTNWRYAVLFAKANAQPTSGPEQEALPIIEEPHRNRTKNRSFFKNAVHPVGFGALSLVLTAALWLVSGNRLSALSGSLFVPPSAPVHLTASSEAVAPVPPSSVPAPSTPASAAPSNRSSSVSSKTVSASKTTSPKASSADEASSAVSSAVDERTRRLGVLDETIKRLKAEITDMDWKLRDYDARLVKLRDKFNAYSTFDNLLAYFRLLSEYQKYGEQYDWKVGYYESLVKQYNELRAEG